MSENKDDVLKKLAHMETLEKFLCGEAQMAKTWFGDKHPSKVGLFWWRTVLRKRFADVAALIRSQSSTIDCLRRELDAVRQQTPSKDWCNRPDLNFVRHVNGAISEKCPKCQRYSPECASPVLCHYDSISKARGRE